MKWKVIVVPLEDAEIDTGTWEPMQVVEDDDGSKLVVCKGMFDSADEDQKSTQVQGSLEGYERG